MKRATRPPTSSLTDRLRPRPPRRNWRPSPHPPDSSPDPSRHPRRLAPMSDVVITVRGEHEIRLAPDLAVAHVTIHTEGLERGPVVERVAALAQPVRADLEARKEAGGLQEWTSQSVSVWTDRPWGPDGTRLAPVHHA